MEDALSILTEFLSILKEDILEYYDKTYSYLKGLIHYKNINLNKTISTENKANIENTLEIMVKTIITSLNTIGVSMNTLLKTQKDFIKTVSGKKEHLQNYESYFNLYKELYLDKILFEILIEYLIDINAKTIDALNLFGLLPQNVTENLNKFKEKYLKSKKIKEVLKDIDLESLIDFSRVSIKNDRKKPIIPPIISPSFPKEQTDSGTDTLPQLRTKKEDTIETLKISNKKLLKPSPTLLEKSFERKQRPDIKKYEQKSSIVLKKTDTKIKTFLDYFGNFPSIHPDLINKFKINTINLINSRVTNPDFIDLECLFFYISILKMLNIESSFTSTEILEIIKNYVNNKIFSSDKNIAPDPMNNFYGLSVIKEINILKNTNIINLFEIEKFIKSELEPFVPEKLELNFYSLLCLKLLEKLNVIENKKDLLLNSILNLQLANLENFKPIFDIFHKLTSIKLLNDAMDITRIIKPYVAELKRNLTLKEITSIMITDMANSLLFFDLLDLKEQEAVLSNQLLNSIINSTQFFESENVNQDFNWRTDKLAYKIELKMLFYALFACSRYFPLNFEKP